MPDIELDALIDKINNSQAQAAAAPPEAKDFREKVDNTDSQKTIEYVKAATFSMMQEKKNGFDSMFGSARTSSSSSGASGFGASPFSNQTSYGNSQRYGYGYGYGYTQKPQISVTEQIVESARILTKSNWEDIVDSREEETSVNMLNILGDNQNRKKHVERKIQCYAEATRLIKTLFIESNRQRKEGTKQ